MHPRSPTRRWLTALWAVLQLAFPLAAALADAGQATRGADVRAHVEGAGATGCATAHATDCATCRQLSVRALPCDVAAPNLPGMADVGSGPGRETQVPQARGRAAFPRGPPAPG